MRMNGEKVHFDRLREDVECASQMFLRMCFAGGQPAEDLRTAGGSLIRAIKRLRDSGEEW